MNVQKIAKLSKEELKSRLAVLDERLQKRGDPLRYRPLQCFKSIYGKIQDRVLHDALFAEIVCWFQQKYGIDRVWDGVIGRVPVLLRGNVYLVAIPFTSGNTTLKLTDHIEDLPEKIGTTLTQEEFNSLGRKVSGATLAFQRLYDWSIGDEFLDDFERGLVWRGLFDLENAAYSLKRVSDTQTTIFHAHAAAEKFLKAALKRSGYNADLKALGHGLPRIFQQLMNIKGPYAWLQSSIDSLQNFAPNMEIRYQLLPRSIENAISAFNASLSVCATLAQMWLFDVARGTEQAQFVPGNFYRDGSGSNFFCKELSLTKDKRPAVVLTRFDEFPNLGMIMMDIVVGVEQSAIYLEVTDVAQINELRTRYEFHLKNRGNEISPTVLGIETTSGPEGSYTTGMVRIDLTEPW